MFGLDKTMFGGDRRTHRQEIGGTWGGHSKREIGLASGLVAGTMVATATGWRPVEAIAEGDLVLTFDHGMQPVASVTRGQLWQSGENCPKSLWPLKVPVDALGNLEDVILLPEQLALVESDVADTLFDDPFAMLTAADLEGYRGIERVAPMGEIEVVQLHLDNDEIVFAAAGMLVHCAAQKMLTVDALLARHVEGEEYVSLKQDAARMLVNCLIGEDAQKAVAA